jgi:osmotically-inducible protein OsmY
MRLLTILALATLVAGAYQFRKSRPRPTPQALSNPQLARRVRAAIESSVANPGGVDVHVLGSTVTLRGRVRKEERDFVLAAALGAPGVTQVSNQLEIDDQPGELGTMQSGIATGV